VYSERHNVCYADPARSAGGYSGAPVDRGPRECVTAPGFAHVLCAAWNDGDNSGPQTAAQVPHAPALQSVAHAQPLRGDARPRCAPQVAEVFSLLGGFFPDFVIKASTLDDFVAALLDDPRALGSLPVVTQEVGDTWVYGTLLLMCIGLGLL